MLNYNIHNVMNFMLGNGMLYVAFIPVCVLINFKITSSV